ncbi:MAG TPA: hypothetical protein VN688_06750 [Gemmataceae bacterium]|nr:hypothetical protein [Gemmataceae bacterium]
MVFTAQAEAPPLREDAAGAVRVGDSRVLLELVIRAFQDGATPELIVQRYSTLTLPTEFLEAVWQFRRNFEAATVFANRVVTGTNVQPHKD